MSIASKHVGFLAVLGLTLPLLAQASYRPDGFVLTQWGRWTQAEATASLDQAAGVGARHVAILVMMCQSRKDAHDIRWCESPENEPFVDSYQGKRLLQLLPEFAARKLTFSLIPFPGSPDLASRQWIWPADRDAWFRRYGDMMVELAGFSERHGARDFLVASELTLLFGLDRPWREVIRRVREVYTGHLTISPVFAQYGAIRFWDALDSIGVSAYFPLSVSERLDSVRALEAGWKAHKAHLVAFAALHRKPLTFVEVGYPTTNVAATMPWDYQWGDRTLDPELQKRCFEAFQRVWSGERRLRGFQIWGLSVQPFELEKAFTPIGKPAEEPVRQLFLNRSSIY